ncbi:MAG: hypothetical protein CL811_04755 [Colwelliaceae bacterium]|nr:hypothetical protein [Colwelliaceae bacterium]|tara:strand:+ start:10147 stop:10968 length:822 start_codon:yes stop_codon:yes gene_type:complete
MKSKFKIKGEIDINKKLRQKKKLIKPFINKYSRPVLVHATKNKKDFIKILETRKIKLGKYNKKGEHLHIESLLNLYPSIFFSLGFEYLAAYDFKFGLIFDLNLLKKTKYYRNSIGFQCYRKAFKYWEDNDPDWVEKLRNTNKSCVEVINTFYNKRYNGKTRQIFEFWKIERELFNLITKYPKKGELIKIFKKVKKDKLVKYPESLNCAIEDYDKDYAPEIIKNKEIKLQNNKLLLGFYVKGDISSKLLKILKEHYPNKLLFDGKNIRKIRELK